jgi:hypothetical protein
LRKDSISKIGLAVLMLVSTVCFAGALGAPDASCNPAVDPPAVGGCTWYNFYAFIADGSIHAGSSFANYYVAASDPPYTLTTSAPAVVRILDGGHQGDTFDVYDNGVFLGESSATPINAGHSCANDPTGAGTDPAACWNDPLMSRGTFPIAAGAHSLTIVWKQMVPGGDSDLQWFEVGAASSTTSGLTFVGSMPDVVAAGDWTTTFTLINKGGASAEANLSLYGDNGLPLNVTLNLLQSSSSLIATSVDRTLAANGSLIVQAGGPANVPFVAGGAQMSAAGPVDGYAIFHENSNSQEAVVPLETRNAGVYLLPFDNTNNLALGVAMQNLSAQAANVNVVVRNDAGVQIGTGNISLPASGHTTFVMSGQFPWTANLRGTAEFDTPNGGQISLLGIRYTPPGTLTTVPVLANVGTGGGSIAHLASGGGWTTTFFLVNAGTSPAQATVSFFGDNGAPLALPVSFPQGTGTASSSSSVSNTLAAGQLLLIQSTGQTTDPLLEGSAQLTTNGNVGGFVIFRYEPTGQEAVVPLETRNAGAYLLGFDNTGSTATGVAINNASGQQANIPVIIRDDTGAQVGTGTIPLAPNGHLSFVLANQFSVTNNIRGTLEFDTPTGTSIGALGIRNPVGGTFTTLPALAR